MTKLSTANRGDSMEENATGKQYELTFELFGTGKDHLTLLKELRKEVVEFTPCVPHLRRIGQKRFEIKLTGSMIDIDRRHFLLRRKYFKGFQIVCVKDEVGDQIRQEAYPLLSDIEQRVRVFISRIMNEEDGGRWWDELVKNLFNAKLSKRGNQKKGYYEHLLEKLDFEDLLKITQHRFAFKDKKAEQISAELTAALKEAGDLDALKKCITDILEPHSLWDDIFSLHFKDQDEFSKLAGILGLVIKERNKVMHHRAISCSCLKNLKQNISTVISILDKKLDALDQERKLELKRRIDALTKVVTQPAVSLPETPSLASLLASMQFPPRLPDGSLAALLLAGSTVNCTPSAIVEALISDPLANPVERFQEMEKRLKELQTTVIEQSESANEAIRHFQDAQSGYPKALKTIEETLNASQESVKQHGPGKKL